MKKNEGYRPQMPPEMTDPSHIPHYPEWPNVPYADWPRTRFHRWNDSEPANVQPWWTDCCDHGENPCVCVTSGDVDLWNSYSGLSALTAFEPSALSAIDDLIDGYNTVSAYSGIWNSAEYVPNIYDNISALYDYLNDKADYSAVSSTLVSALSSFHIWTDSEKAAHEAGAYGDFGGTIVGLGTYERPIRVAPDVAKAMFLVQSATNNFTTPLVNNNVIDAITADIKTLDDDLTNTQAEVSGNRVLIEWIVNHLNAVSAANMWFHQKVTPEESKQKPNYFYYWEE